MQAPHWPSRTRTARIVHSQFVTQDIQQRGIRIVGIDLMPFSVDGQRVAYIFKLLSSRVRPGVWLCSCG